MINLGSLRLCLLAASLGLLAGCAPISNSNGVDHEPAPQPPQVGEAADMCGAQQVQDRIGRYYDAALGEAVRAESGATVLRIIRPGHAYTMDYRGDRINIHIDDGELITSIGCG